MEGYPNTELKGNSLSEAMDEEVSIHAEWLGCLRGSLDSVSKP